MVVKIRLNMCKIGILGDVLEDAPVVGVKVLVEKFSI